MRHETQAAAEPKEEEIGFSGIGDLIREEETIDLAKVVGSEKDTGIEVPLSLDREKNWPLRLKKSGIDFDEFLSYYPRSFTHTSQMKSLVEISRRVSAVSAGLLLKKPNGYFLDLAVGVNEKTFASLKFVNGDPILGLMSMRRVVAVNRNIVEVRTLRSRIDVDDLRYMRRLLIIPAIFRGQDGYLFFSFSSESDIVMEYFLSSLKIQ
jgi:hypothetical protein